MNIWHGEKERLVRGCQRFASSARLRALHLLPPPYSPSQHPNLRVLVKPRDRRDRDYVRENENENENALDSAGIRGLEGLRRVMLWQKHNPRRLRLHRNG